MKETPRDLGFRWPAEWERHRSTWLTWPRNSDTWPGVFARIPAAYWRMVEAIAQFESVHLLVAQESLDEVHDFLGAASEPIQAAIQVHLQASNDAWIRDHGPQFLVRERADTRELAVNDWGYNAWGGKYPPFDLDNAIPEKISKLLGCRRFQPSLILEGGAIEGNGNGVALTTVSCLLDQQRNSDVSQSTISDQLRRFGCIDELIWLPGDGIAGDDTAGHIDQMARFIDERTIVFAAAASSSSEERRLAENRAALERLERFEIIDLPLPTPMFHDGQRLPASYCNFYIVNGAVLVPAFDDPRDDEATSVLRACFPGRTVIPIDCTDLIVGLGAVHCLSQQEPSSE